MKSEDFNLPDFSLFAFPYTESDHFMCFEMRKVSTWLILSALYHNVKSETEFANIYVKSQSNSEKLYG